MKKWAFLGFLFVSSLFAGTTDPWPSYKQKALLYQKTIPGWCCREKATKLMDLVYEIHPQVCVEVGVFGGSSVYPIAKALSYLNSGMIYAIDPWSNEECLKGYSPGNPNYDWWSKVDLEGIYQQFKTMLEQQKVSSFCHVMRMTADVSASYFADESIDMLHIDGNHERALADVKLFLPKLKKGKYLWFDDANWASTKPAIIYLNEQCILDPKRSIGNDCLLFKKR